jgi:hypothetical protein
VSAAAGVDVRTRDVTPTGVRRLRWTRELALVALLYGVYLAARAVIGVPVSDAIARGGDILDLEGFLHLDVERTLNRGLTAVPALGLLAAYLYATLHYVVTPVVLGWVALRRRADYRVARNGLVLATGLGLVGYWLLPTAPPRLVTGGFTDTMARFSDLGWWGDAASAPRGMESLSNQYAAMPSLHVGWAVWVALVLTRLSPSPTVRRWAWAYPAVMALVVMSTANHYLLDAVAGAAVALAGTAIARRLRTQTPEGTTDEHHGTAAPSAHHPAGHLVAALDAGRAAPGRTGAHGVAHHQRRAGRAGDPCRPGGSRGPGRVGAAPARPEPARLGQPRSLVGAQRHSEPVPRPVAGD